MQQRAKFLAGIAICLAVILLSIETAWREIERGHAASGALNTFSACFYAAILVVLITPPHYSESRP